MVKLLTFSFLIYTTEAPKCPLSGRFSPPTEPNPVPRQDYHLLR